MSCEVPNFCKHRAINSYKHETRSKQPVSKSLPIRSRNWASGAKNLIESRVFTIYKTPPAPISERTDASTKGICPFACALSARRRRRRHAQCKQTNAQCENKEQKTRKSAFKKNSHQPWRNKVHFNFKPDRNARRSEKLSRREKARAQQCTQEIAQPSMCAHSSQVHVECTQDEIMGKAPKVGAPRAQLEGGARGMRGYLCLFIAAPTTRSCLCSMTRPNHRHSNRLLRAYTICLFVSANGEASEHQWHQKKILGSQEEGNAPDTEAQVCRRFVNDQLVAYLRNMAGAC